MAAHARLKNKFTEDEKCHNLMRELNCFQQLLIVLDSGIFVIFIFKFVFQEDVLEPNKNVIYYYKQLSYSF